MPNADDHARIAFTDMHPDEKWPQAVQFLHNAVAYFASLGVRVHRVLTDGARFSIVESPEPAPCEPPEAHEQEMEIVAERNP